MQAVVTQSNYLPWRGWFDQADCADVVVLYDSVQYTKRDWRSRNRVRGPQSETWITVPVRVKGRFSQAIDEAELDGSAFFDRHRRTIQHAYAKAPYWDEVDEIVATIAETVDGATRLTEVNEAGIRVLFEALGIGTTIRRDREFDLAEDRVDRLIGICRDLGADRYLSGPKARSYLDEERFADAGIDVVWMEYDHYESYAQWGEGFQPEVSVIDTIAHQGCDATIEQLRRSRPSHLREVIDLTESTTGDVRV